MESRSGEEPEEALVSLEGLDDVVEQNSSIENKIKKLFKRKVYTEDELVKKREREETFPLFTVIFDHLEPFLLHIGFAMVFSALFRCFQLLYPIYIAISIDTLRGKPPGWIILLLGSDADVSYTVSLLTIIVIIIYLAQSFLGWLYQVVFTTLGEGLKHSIRMEIFDKIQVREVALITSENKKDLMRLLIEDCEQLEKLLLKGLRDLCQLAASIIVGSIFMIFINWKLTIIALSPCIFLFFMSILYWYQVETYLVATFLPNDVLHERLHNTLEGGFVPMQSLDMQISEYNRIATTSRALQTAKKKMLGMKGRYNSIVYALTLVGIAGVVAVGSFWLLTDSDHSEDLSVGYYTFFILIIPMIVLPFSRIGVTLQLYRRTTVSILRILKFLRAMPSIKNPIHPTDIDTSQKHTINIENVSFSNPEYNIESYKRDHEAVGVKVMSNVSLDVLPSSCIAVTGVPNSGFDMIPKLLLRLYDVDEGEILIGNVNVKEIDFHDLHSLVSLVPRDPYIFEGSIAENINYGSVESLHRPDVLEEIKQLAERAQLSPLLESLPNGVHTVLSEYGRELSMGERQLICIARALRQHSQIIVLHETTSLLDFHMDRILLENFRRIFANKTVVIASSKLSLVRQAEKIFVFNNGAVEEEGTHEELKGSASGIYSSLWDIYCGDISGPSYF